MNKVFFWGVIFFALIAFNSPAMAVTYFNSEGKKIDELEYEKAKNKRSPEIQKILADGYGEENTNFKDPVLLRKKRIEQWKAYRKTKP